MRLMKKHQFVLKVKSLKGASWKTFCSTSIMVYIVILFNKGFFLSLFDFLHDLGGLARHVLLSDTTTKNI